MNLFICRMRYRLNMRTWLKDEFYRCYRCKGDEFIIDKVKNGSNVGRCRNCYNELLSFSILSWEPVPISNHHRIYDEMSEA